MWGAVNVRRKKRSYPVFEMFFRRPSKKNIKRFLSLHIMLPSGNKVVARVDASNTHINVWISASGFVLGKTSGTFLMNDLKYIPDLKLVLLELLNGKLDNFDGQKIQNSGRNPKRAICTIDVFRAWETKSVFCTYYRSLWYV